MFFLLSSVVTQPEICSRSTTFLWKIGADSEQYSKKKEGIGAMFFWEFIK